MHEIESRTRVLNLVGANEATKSMVVASFLVAATRLFDDDLYLSSERYLSGRRGYGYVDYSVHSRKTHDHTLGVMEVKRVDFKQGVAQNMVQLESALTEKKRRCKKNEVDGEEESPGERKVYGVVTDSVMWAFIECTLHENETVSFKMSKLKERLDYAGSWQEEAKSVFAKIVWLWSKMVEVDK